MGGFKGIAVVSKNPTKTRNLWGDISEIAGQSLDVLDRNDEGDCLCFLQGKGLVDVDHVDIVKYTEAVDPLKVILKLFKQNGK